MERYCEHVVIDTNKISLWDWVLIFDPTGAGLRPSDLRVQFFQIVYRLHTFVGGPEILCVGVVLPVLSYE